MSAQERIKHFLKMWDAKPLYGRADSIYGFHVGTEWEAEVTITDLREITALNAELLAALEGMMKNHYEPHSQEWINAANAVAKARN